jgi:hypothetical protein
MTDTKFIEREKDVCYKWGFPAPEGKGLSVKDLWRELLHLATYGDWQIEENAGSLNALGYTGGFGNVLRRLWGKSNALHIFGFTNKDISKIADPANPNKIYEDIATFVADLRKYHQKYEEKQFRGETSSTRVFVEYFLGDFLKNALSSTFVKDWQLIRDRKLRPRRTGDKPTYQLTFMGGNGFAFPINFAEDDVVYFCQPMAEENAPQKFRIWEKPISRMTTCQDEKQTQPVFENVHSIIEKIERRLVPQGKWRTFIPRRSWKATSNKNGIPVIWISEYEHGFGAENIPTESERQNTYLVELENISSEEDLWRLKFVINRPGFFQRSTNFIVYGDEMLELATCPLL